MPSAFGRIVSAVRSNRDSGVIVLAILIVALCVLGGYFTASAIVKRADRRYDLFGHVAPGYAAAGGGVMPGPMPGTAFGTGGPEPRADAQYQTNQHPSQRSMADRESELRRKQGF
jgi:hypothetical protein